MLDPSESHLRRCHVEVVQPHILPVGLEPDRNGTFEDGAHRRRVEAAPVRVLLDGLVIYVDLYVAAAQAGGQDRGGFVAAEVAHVQARGAGAMAHRVVHYARLVVIGEGAFVRGVFVV